MKTDVQEKTVGDLVGLHNAEMIVANPEYQRGAVWKTVQKQKLIDSLLRGYRIPIFYLQLVEREAAGLRRQGYEVIDGQQRLEALSEFCDGAFSLLDPVKDEKKAKFPEFIKHQECPWGGKKFTDFSEDEKKNFLNTHLSIAEIKAEENEVRDLFIRLQSGFPLNPQEKRDAMPGKFNSFILELGGKLKTHHQGHDFFRNVMGMKPEGRGKIRQVASQIAMLYILKQENRGFSDTKSSALDDFYYEKIDFDTESDHVKKLQSVLDKAAFLFGDGQRKRLQTHDAIHLILLIDSLMHGYVNWESKITTAFDKFREKVLESMVLIKEGFDANNIDKDLLNYSLRYSNLIRTLSDQQQSIETRHAFYLAKMMEFIQPTPKDSKRAFDPIEREIIYYRYHKLCAECEKIVRFDDAEIHHIDGHSGGGRTSMDNAALVHKHCHPKGAAKEKEFRDKFMIKNHQTSSATAT